MSNNQKIPSWPELTAILLARLGFLWLLVFASLLMPNDDTAFYAFMGIAFIITIPYSLWLRSKMRSTQFAPLQFIVDLVLVTGLIYFTGGIQSDLTLLYPLVILSAGIVSPPKQAAQITALGIITYVLMATVLSQNLIVEYLPAGAPMPAETSMGALLFRVLIFAAFGVVSIHVAKRCDYINTQAQDLQETAITLLNNNPAPSFLLNAEGFILRANALACEQLSRTIDQLCTMEFKDLCTEGPLPIDESYGKSAYLSRNGHPALPVAYQTSEVTLKETALIGSKGRKNEKIRVTMLVFNDISRPLALENQLSRVERITSATRIAGEMAHEIRTPLTAISASVQLLKCYEDKATSADWLPNSPRRLDRQELFGHIEDASHRMDTVIKNFVDFADFSPSDLLSIIRLDSTAENKGYIGHLNTKGRGFKHGKNSDSG